MSNSIIDGAEGLKSLKEHGWYDWGSVFVYDSDGNDISTAVQGLVWDNSQSTGKLRENTAVETPAGSSIDRILQSLRRRFFRK